MLKISKNRCVGCGICETVCPINACKVNLSTGIAEIDSDRCAECFKCLRECPQNAFNSVDKNFVFAIGTDDGISVKNGEHVGDSEKFIFYQYKNSVMNYLEERKNPKFIEEKETTHGDPNKAKAVSEILKNADAIVGTIMGPNIVRLRKKFVPVIIRNKTIEEACKIIQENIADISIEFSKDERKGVILS